MDELYSISNIIINEMVSVYHEITRITAKPIKSNFCANQAYNIPGVSNKTYSHFDFIFQDGCLYDSTTTTS